MHQVAAPASIRAQALAFIGAHLQSAGAERTPVEAGAEIPCDPEGLSGLLLALERRFDIPLDPPVCFLGLTPETLADLVELQVSLRPLPPHPSSELVYIDRERARRARGEVRPWPVSPPLIPAKAGTQAEPVYLPPPAAIDRHMTWRDVDRLLWTAFWISVAFAVLGALVYGVAVVAAWWVAR